MKRVFALCFSVVLFVFVLKAEAVPAVAASQASREMVEKMHGDFYRGAESYYKTMLEGEDRRYRKVMSSVESYIDFFASQYMQEIPEWERPALDLARQGKYVEAITIYNDKKLMANYTAGSESYESIKRFVVLLQLSGVRENAMQGMAIYREVARIEEASGSVRSMYPLINLAIDLRLFTMAEDYFYKYRDSAKGDPAMMATVLGYRTQMLYRRNRPNEALVHGRQSIVMYDSICKAQKNQEYEVLSRARVHLALARIYHKLQEKELCIKHIRNSRICFQMEAKVNGDINLIERIRALYDLAPMAADENEFFLADSIFTEVDAMGSWLYENNKFQRTQFKFNALRFRGLSCYRVGKNAESRIYFEQASELLDEMEALSPGENLEHHQNLNFNIASLYYQEKNYEKALELDRKVLALVLEDKIHDELKHKIDLSYCYKYIGNCLWALAYQKYLDSKKKKTKEVMNLYMQAFESYSTALQYNARDAESQSRYNFVDYILTGMEKPMGIPKNF